MKSIKKNCRFSLDLFSFKKSLMNQNRPLVSLFFTNGNDLISGLEEWQEGEWQEEGVGAAVDGDVSSSIGGGGVVFDGGRREGKNEGRNEERN
jgi:hypothetical protein